MLSTENVMNEFAFPLIYITFLSPSLSAHYCSPLNKLIDMGIRHYFVMQLTGSISVQFIEDSRRFLVESQLERDKQN